MNKEQLRRWIEQHQGDEWEEERARMIEENIEVSMEIIRDVIQEMATQLQDALDDATNSIAIEEKLEEMTEFPEVQNLLKGF